MSVDAPFKFEDPTYIIKAVSSTGASPVAKGYTWPKSGPVDDRENWNPEHKCGGGLYGYTIDHLRGGSNGGGYFDCPCGITPGRKKNFLILEVERSEIVQDGIDKCKVPRCNVVGCYDVDDWHDFCTKWSQLLGNVMTPEEVMEKFMHWVGRLTLTDSLREELQAWMDEHENLHKAGDGCQSDDDLNTFKLVRDGLDPRHGTWVKEKPTQDNEKVKIIADWMCTTTCPGARMIIWAMLQKNIEWLFAVHPYIEKVMVQTASKTCKQDKYPLSSYHGWEDQKAHPLSRRLNYFNSEDAKEVREILGL